MTTPPVETQVTPPEVDNVDDGDGDLPSSRISVTHLDVNDVHYDAGVQLFGTDADDPEKFADALLGAALAVAALKGSDYTWSAMQRFAAYDGIPT